jgi:hypothetical protein
LVGVDERCAGEMATLNEKSFPKTNYFIFETSFKKFFLFEIGKNFPAKKNFSKNRDGCSTIAAREFETNAILPELRIF